EICLRKAFIVLHSFSTKSFMNSMKPSLPPNLRRRESAHPKEYLVKLANVWIVLAIRVRLRAAFSSGPPLPGVRPNRLGDRMAGHRKRRKMDPLMRLSQSSSSRCPPDSRCR
ncbi:unnamed protein product, partial [Ixodes pacificus]